jgi:hypothetical protein
VANSAVIGGKEGVLRSLENLGAAEGEVVEGEVDDGSDEEARREEDAAGADAKTDRTADGTLGLHHDGSPIIWISGC